MMDCETSDVQQQRKYFCHACTSEIDHSLPDFICPQCHSEFVEEMPRSSATNVDHIAQPDEVREMNVGRRWTRAQRRRHGAPIHSLIDSILSHLRDNSQHLSTRRRAQLRAYESLAAGVENLDEMITHLLNQLSVVGQEPASEEQLSRLPLASFRPQCFEGSQQCSVCLEAYDVGDVVTTLPCNHYYHNTCIIRWLQQCGTCPVCRQSLTAADEAAAAGRADSDAELLLSASSQQPDTQEENLTVVTVAMETASDVEVPVLSPNSVIDDVEYFETEARL